MIHLRQLGPALVRHVEAYAQLAAAAGRDLRAIAVRRVMLAAFGAVLGIALVVLLGGTLIAAGWESPYRAWIAGSVLLALALGAFGCLRAAASGLPDSTHLQALKEEWQKDRAWLASRGRRPLPDERSLAVAAAGARRAGEAQERTPSTSMGA